MFGLVFVGAVTMPVATAEQPARMDTYVTDSAGALDTGDSQRVRAAVDTLYAEHKVRLWIAYVDNFAGTSPQNWAARTARQSGFGERDLLLAVATRDRAYAFDGEAPSGVSESEIDRILTGQVEPALRDDRWADAGVAAAAGIGSAMSGGGVSMGPVLLIGVLIVLALVGLLLYQRYRSEPATGPNWNRPGVPIPPIPPHSRHCRSKPCTRGHERFWSNSTTPSGPAPKNWNWPWGNSGTRQYSLSGPRWSTRAPPRRKRSPSGSGSTTPFPRPPMNSAPC